MYRCRASFQKSVRCFLNSRLAFGAFTGFKREKIIMSKDVKGAGKDVKGGGKDVKGGGKDAGKGK